MGKISVIIGGFVVGSLLALGIHDILYVGSTVNKTYLKDINGDGVVDLVKVHPEPIWSYSSPHEVYLGLRDTSGNIQFSEENYIPKFLEMQKRRNESERKSLDRNITGEKK